MDKTSTEMSAAEWEVMRIIWTLGQASSHEVISASQREKDWSDSTIKTLLRRLVSKDVIRVEKVGRRFIYHPIVPEEEAMEVNANHLFEHMCNMKKGKVILELIEKTTLSQADIKAMQILLAEKLTDAPEKVSCNCIQK